MWSRPAISFAEEFGINGRGLGTPLPDAQRVEKRSKCHCWMRSRGLSSWMNSRAPYEPVER